MSQEVDKEVPGNIDCDFHNPVKHNCRKLSKTTLFTFYQVLIDDFHWVVTAHLYNLRLQMGVGPKTSFRTLESSLWMYLILSNPERRLNSVRCRLLSPAWNAAARSEPGMSPVKPSSHGCCLPLLIISTQLWLCRVSWCLAEKWLYKWLTIDDGMLDRPH